MQRNDGGQSLRPPYDRMLEGILAFADLGEAEDTIRRLEDFRHRFESAGDKKGVEYCRRIGLRGRRRAELISRNRRVGRAKQLEKAEIALWFRIWLETPDLFLDWLELRKGTPGFRELQRPAGEVSSSGS
ncbi:MAG: hypothetical protein ABIG68_12190, partial [Acidobacteriota bacterium]